MPDLIYIVDVYNDQDILEKI